MAKQRINPGTTKKHIARAERERRQRRLIILATIVVAVMSVGLILFGWIEMAFTPVATANGVGISTNLFQGRVRLADLETINQLAYQDQVDLIFETLSRREDIGQNVLDQLIDDILIKDEVESRGLSVSEEEVDIAIAEAFGFYPGGTPTPFPTSTPDPTRTALASITPTVTEGPSPTPLPTSTPGPSPTAILTSTPWPTPTVYTKEAFEENYQETLANFKELYDISEEDFRNQFVAQLYRQKLFEQFLDEIPRDEEHVQARHILLEDEATALLVLRLLEEGGDWEELASEFSTDESNKDRGGDLGWFPRGRMVPEFETAVFDAEIGILQEPVETSFGWHIIEVLGNEIREVDEYTHQFNVQGEFDAWLTEARENADVRIKANWASRVPPMPNLSRIFGQ
jgi:parvulin-like peptidyl-prolyl isomerase